LTGVTTPGRLESMKADSEYSGDVLNADIGDRPPAMDPEDPRAYITGGRRVAMGVCPWMGDEGAWWTGTSPRNGRHASVEGPWEDWVTLAREILAADAEARQRGFI
jgi:hypothetical protein